VSFPRRGATILTNLGGKSILHLAAANRGRDGGFHFGSSIAHFGHEVTSPIFWSVVLEEFAMKRNVVRLTLGLAAMAAMLIGMEGQAKAFGHHHHGSCGSCGGSYSSCGGQGSCGCEQQSSCGCQQQSSCGCEQQSSCGCQQSSCCESSCGHHHHRHHQCCGYESSCGCGSSCGSSCGCDSGSSCGCSGSSSSYSSSEKSDKDNDNRAPEKSEKK
jgi:hypothetical protein